MSKMKRRSSPSQEEEQHKHCHCHNYQNQTSLQNHQQRVSPPNSAKIKNKNEYIDKPWKHLEFSNHARGEKKSVYLTQFFKISQFFLKSHTNSIQQLPTVPPTSRALAQSISVKRVSTASPKTLHSRIIC